MKNILLIVAVIAIVAGAAYFLSRPDGAPSPAQMPADETPIPVEGQPGFETGGAVVRYTEDGFSPSTITVPLGTTVTFANESSREMWVATDQHPSHTGYAGTSRSEHCPTGGEGAFDQCARGDSFAFTFDKAGIWAYHDHVNAQYKGTVVVTE